MKAQTRNLLIGGAVVLGGALCGWYLYEKSQPVKETEPLSKELIIQILNEQEREHYPVFKCMCSIFIGVLQRPEAKQMPFNELKANVMRQHPQIEQHYDAISVKVLDKYGVDKRELFKAVQETFKDDQEIQKLMQKTWMNFEKACQGIPQDFVKTLPDFLTPEKTLQIRAKLIKKEAERIEKIFEPIDEEGRSFWEDEERVSSFIHSSRVEISINEEIKEVLDDEGLDAFEEAPERIFDSALFKYIEEDPEFKRKFQELEQERVSFAQELGKRKLRYSS